MSSEEDAAEMAAPEKPSPSNPLSFKKPLLIGKVGRLPRRLTSNKEDAADKPAESTADDSQFNQESPTGVGELSYSYVATQETPDKGVPLPYKEPAWSGLPQSGGKDYEFEVLKSGIVIETINLMDKPFWVFGRFATCDICLVHPTISRYHAILQFRSQASEDQPRGFYIYDLASTHGTFLNKSRLKNRVYARVQVGHMIKFGCSTRTFLLIGPNEDMEEESEFTITELRHKRAAELLNREEMEKEMDLQMKQQEEAKQKMLEEKGVDWGMGEDAVEEADVAENPFAQTNNEDLYLDDPKKALRGFMEREGYDLEYDCNEQGMGQFLCKVELPIDDEKGRPIVAEVLHKGKKKEAVVQCALEACRILDRYGLLRQATHESRKRKVKNWEENDFYDSDDDTFLDRTGVIEKKRENRMKAKLPQLPETYQSLTEKQRKLAEEIAACEKLLYESNQSKISNSSTNEEDSLDSYMKELKQSKLDKQNLKKLKTNVHKLKQEYAGIAKLVDIAKPTDLPALVERKNLETPDANTKHKKLPLYGKRLKVKVQVPPRSEIETSTNIDDDEDDEDGAVETKHDDQNAVVQRDKSKKSLSNVLKPSGVNLEEKYVSACDRIDSSLKKLFNFTTAAHETLIGDIWDNLKQLKYDAFSDETKRVAVSLISNYVDGVDVTVREKVSKLVGEITTAVGDAGTADSIVEAGKVLVNIVKEVTFLVNKLNDAAGKEDEPGSTSELEKKRKKNQRRVQHRQEKAEMEKRRGYEEDASKEDYNMWVPPAGQTGDGRTCLNDKLGY